MAATANIIVAALAMTGCTDLQPSSFPTSPTSMAAAPVASVPVPAGRVVRTERWALDLTMREAYGAGECDAGIGTTRPGWRSRACRAVTWTPPPPARRRC
jgi:hypothetical protein